jgi:adenine-specific DNA-methyltransferase
MDLFPNPGPPDEYSAKALGAFYTSIQVADFLVWWAVRASRDTVMDPSFGGGVFIRSACSRLVALGGNPENQVFGVELDPKVHGLIGDKLADEFGLSHKNLWRKDFFDLEPLPVNKVNAVVGNPPFIRYHKFHSDIRNRALAQAADHGVRLTQLSSSWAPFVIHSVSMLKNGGRLAMVLPMELGHAAYALPVFKYVVNSFGKVTILTFRKKLFPHLSEDTILLLAAEKGRPFSGLLHRDLANAGVLADIQKAHHGEVKGTRRLNSTSLSEGAERLVEYLIPKKARELYQELKHSSLTKRLGEFADVGIGYVTGANDFFHLSPKTAQALSIPKRFLRPAVRRGRALAGLRFTSEDWLTAINSGDSGYLLSISREAELPISVRKYLSQGTDKRIPEAYKCRVRSPWYSVPHVYEPDAFLTYMSGKTPRLVANNAKAVAPNTLHVVRLHAHTKLTTGGLAALWPTSLTRLSVEIEGHALGGGMLKLEPTEAESCVMANPNVGAQELAELAGELDGLMRSGREGIAQDRADKLLLRKSLGLSQTDCRLLKEASESLLNRRCGRNSA